ncbi:MAG: glycosyltransferase family 2 protein [Armatimonadetes bacterium]|nr:glycosyltransferase family 2 protein [Armatimonadota bacterium]MDE2205784.1 glycosyltransferase family 2 protein [Armatimonadota bacterium]
MSNATQDEGKAAAVAGATATLESPELSVLLPIYNERESALALIERVCAVPLHLELIIVDDGSNDGTTDLLRNTVEGRRENVRVYYHTENRGKGAAIRTAIPHARSPITIIQDGDMEYWPEDFPAIINAFAVTGSSVVYGSRFLNGWPRMALANRLINRLLPWMVRVLYGARITDEATCYKAFRTALLQTIPLRCRRFEFCPEVTARVLRRGFSIVETPIRYEARSVAQGKKIRWTDGVQAIWTLVRWRFGPP